MARKCGKSLREGVAGAAGGTAEGVTGFIVRFLIVEAHDDTG